MSFLRDDSGKSVGIMGVSHDVTERKQMEDALRKARDELEQRVKERTAELSALNQELDQDITERKKVEDSLRRNEERFRSLIDQAADAIFVHDFHGRFLEVNRQACTSLGYTPDELLSMSVSDVDPDAVPRGDSAKFWPNLPATFEARHRRKDGTTFPVEVRLAAIEYGETKVLLATARDLTDRKRAEELALQAARLRAIADLSSGVAHHFNNLLQIVIGNTSLSLADLESGDLSEIKTNLEQMLRAATLGAETVKRLQTFANMRADVTESESAVFDIATTARNAAEVSKPLWKSDSEKKGIKIDLQLDLEDGCLVKGQENEMFEVLVNLIRNAAEAMPQGGDIEVKTYREADEVVVTVRDTGTGIAEEDLPKVFQPFWSSKGVGIGKGMGLAVTHGLVKRHGGTISVQSKVGEGTTFTIRLPLAQEPVRKTEEPAISTAEDHLTILVIDDDLNIATLLERICAKAGHSVFRALSGEEGLAIFNKEPVDLVISDLGMPGMNGWDVGKPIDRATVLSTVQEIAERFNIQPRVT